MILLAVAILAVMAITATAYIAVARLDRRGASEYQRSTSLDQQVEVVVDHIGALLAADLFGGKIVRKGTPQTAFLNGRNTIVWPRAFEDGEFSDYPRTAFLWDDTPTSNKRTFDEAEPGDSPSDNAQLTRALGPVNAFVPDPRNPGLLQRFAPVPADDCWLASSEPIDARPNGASRSSTSPDGLWDTWLQITNLRCGWEFRDPDGPRGPEEPTWIRGDGRFVDLGQFVVQSLDGRGDPAADLQYEVDPITRAPVASDSNIVDPLIQDLTGAQLRNGPEAGVNQPVYGVQMSQIASVNGPTPGRLTSDLDLPECPDPTQPCDVENQSRLSDERFWADCDGDTFPDCRWQKLDALGDLFGLRWVVAARVVDHSALVNINSSLTFNYGVTNPSNVSDGMTPADVDLARLLRRSAGVSANEQSTYPGHPDVVGMPFGDVEQAIRNHVNNGLRLKEDTPGGAFNGEGFLKNVMDNVFAQPLRDELLAFFPATNSSLTYLTNDLDSLTRDQRFAYYRFVGASPQRPRVGGARPYPQGDEIDLRAYFGFNNTSMVGAFEQAMDDLVGDGLSKYLFGNTGVVSGLPPNPYALQEIGLVRSKELLEEVRTYSDQSLAEQANPVGSAGYGQDDKVTRVMRDVRRLMTTVSGTSLRSPVPVLNISDSAFRNRDFFGKPLVGQALDTRNSKDDARFIRDSFASFVWALAPFATDQPLAHPMTASDVAKDASGFHYGGTPTGVSGVAPGPAQAVEALAGQDMGASYALLRALALAVNLHDAIDREGPAVGPSPDPAQERPTIVRFFPDDNPNIANAWLPPAGALTTSFPQGSVDAAQRAAALPPQYVGQPDQGVTAAGLETQPFLISSTIFTAYRDEDITVGGDPPDLDLTSPDAQLGTLFLVEIGNPWPVRIATQGYSVAISTAGATNRISFQAALPNEVLDPGERRVYYVDMGNTRSDLAAEWAAVRDAYLMGVAPLAAVEMPLQPGMFTNLPAPSPANGFAPFDQFVAEMQGQGLSAAPVLLLDERNGFPFVVDRLVASTGMFPDTLLNNNGGAVYTFNSANRPAILDTVNDPNERWTGRTAFSVSVKRPAGPPAAGGFPAYVIERPGDNVVTRNDPLALPVLESTWAVSPLGVVEPDPGPAALVSGPPHPAPPVNNSDQLPNMPSFQLFVPNGPLYGASELGQISAFCHLYMHQSSINAPSLVKAHEVDFAKPGVAGFGPGRWLTVSEQLGADWHLLYDGVSTPNPYLGVLDPTRFTPGGDLTSPMGGGRPLPDALAVPLATRVFDAFEALRPIDPLLQGKINVNTASVDTLRLLPLVSPNANLLGGALAAVVPDEGLSGRIANNRDRAATIAAYRDARTDNGMVPASPAQFEGLNTGADSRSINTGLSGLRSREDRSRVFADIPNALRSRGPFAGVQSLGELALLAQWSQTNGSSATPDIGGMADMLAAGRDGVDNPQAPLDLRPNPLAGFEGVDDPEERMALFRAISNIATTRSDVFGAWIIVRGFDPQKIELLGTTLGPEFGDDCAQAPVPIPDNPDDEQIMRLLNCLEDIGGVAYETRWFVLFDRSNVVRPTDRPRVLLKVQMPLE